MQTIDLLWHNFLRRPYRLAFTEQGSGAPLVLLHGLAANRTLWQPLLRVLPPGWRVLAPDLLGFGQSPRPLWNSYEAHQHSRMVAALMRRRLHEPAVIVGHSMGCLIAVDLAARYPHLVKRLILYEPPLFAEDPAFVRHAHLRRHYFAFFAYVIAHPRWAFAQSFFMRLARRLVGVGVDASNWVAFERSLHNTIMGQQAYQQLRNIPHTIPIDIVHGRLDFVVIRTDVRAMLRDMPQVRWHMVTDMHGLSRRSAKYLLRLIAV